jgi:hypothetical protein
MHSKYPLLNEDNKTFSFTLSRRGEFKNFICVFSVCRPADYVMDAKGLIAFRERNFTPRHTVKNAFGIEFSLLSSGYCSFLALE